MKCPFCQATESKVIDKRDTENVIRRRRECLKCQKRFTTHEAIEDISVMVIKKDNTRCIFDKSKVRLGIAKSCEKRPVSSEEIDNMTDKVEAKIKSKGLKEIESKKIGQEIMRELKKKDKIAYIRFASVYREFADIEDFKSVLNKL